MGIFYSYTRIEDLERRVKILEDLVGPNKLPNDLQEEIKHGANSANDIYTEVIFSPYALVEAFP